MAIIDVGETIREYRKRMGLNQEELAELASLNRITIAKYEAGKVEPGAQALARIADALEVSVDALLGRASPAAVSEDEDKMAIREQIRRNPDLHMLFSTAIKADPKNIRAATAMLKAFETENEVD